MKTDKWFFQLFLSQPGMIGELMSGVPRDVEYEYHSIFWYHGIDALLRGDDAG